MKIEALRTIAQILNSDSGKALAKLNVGDVLRVQVISKSENEVVLRLTDGRTISASTLVPIDAAVGELADFLVSKKANGQVFLETLKLTSEVMPEGKSIQQIKSILNSMNLPADSQNIHIIKEMIGREMQINKQNVQSVLNNLRKFPGLDVQKAVFMLANGVDFKEKNINLLNQYSESRIALGNQLKAVLAQIDDIDNIETLKNIFEKFSVLEQKGLIKNQGAENKGSGEAAPETLADKNLINNQKGQISGEEIKSGFEKIQKEVLPAIKQFILQNIENNTKNKPYIGLLQGKEIDINTIKQIICNIDSNELKTMLGKLPENNKTAIEQLLRQGFDIKDNKNTIPLPADAGNDDISGLEVIKERIKSLFQKHFISNTSDSLAEDLNIKDSYREILIKLNVLKEGLTAGVSRGDLLNLIGQAEDNLKFMNNISQYNTFIQVPLNIWGQNTNGELFILKNSKKKIDPNNASVFLSLEMPNIGLTEVLINVAYGNIHCSFKVQDDGVMSLVRKHSPELINALNKEGYKFITVDCGLIRERTGLLDINQVLLKDKQARNKSFDVRV